MLLLHHEATVLDLNELRALVAIHDTASLTAAASQLGLPRTTLRRRVEELESRLGVRLVHRDHRGALLTDAGRVAVDRARPLLAHAEELAIAVREAALEELGTLRMSLPVGLAPEIFLAVANLVRATAPDLQLELLFHDGDDAPVDVDLHVVIGGRPAEGPWKAFACARVRVWLLASPAWLELHGAPTTVEDAAALPLICWCPRRDHRPALPLLSGGELPIQPLMRSSHVHFLREAASAGLAPALLPDALIPVQTVGSEALVPLLPDVIGARTSVWALIPEERAAAPRVRVFVDALRAYSETLPAE